MNHRSAAAFVGIALAILSLCALGQDPNVARGKELREPSWPQRFEVRGSEPASFGFAVTQPGPIEVEVQSKGPPLRVQLDGPAQVQRAGDGRVVISHVATPQDIQKSAFWGVRIALASPAAGRAMGQVSVRHPPADPARVTTELTTLQNRVKGEKRNVPQAETAAINRLNAQFEAHVAKSGHALADARRAQKLQAQSAIESVQGSASVTTRAVAPQQDARIEQQAGARKRILRPEPPPLPPPPPPPPSQPASPVISALSTSQGSPGSPPAILPTTVVISGSGFSSQPGKVHFVVNPGMDKVATTDWWSDGMIRAYVPDATGILAFDGLVYVERAGDGASSAPANFRFEPALETRKVIYTSDRRIGWPGDDYQVLNQSLPDYGAHRINHHNGNPFVGYAGNDEFFLNTRLQNGWVLDDVFLTLRTERRGGAYIQEKRVGTNWPYVNVRFWVDACFGESNGSAAYYAYMVLLKGPRGVPDGLAVK